VARNAGQFPPCPLIADTMNGGLKHQTAMQHYVGQSARHLRRRAIPNLHPLDLDGTDTRLA